MKTIEGRAEEYAKRKSGCQPWQYASSAYRSYKQIYIDIATEQKEIDDAEYKKLRTLAYDMYTSAQYLSTDASKLRKAMDAFHQYVCYEEIKEEQDYEDAH